MMSALKKGTLVFLAAMPLAGVAEVPAKEALCRSCHGAAGAAPIMPVYPKLAGQNKAYLVSAIKAYRDGSRKGGMAAVMTASSTNISDSEIEQLAEYYASQDAP